VSISPASNASLMLSRHECPVFLNVYTAKLLVADTERLVP
jgi:hypothetical protein